MARIGRRLSLILFAALSVLPTVALAQAQNDGLWQALKEGRAVALMRHAYAPGVGDPENFRLDDCSTQRNLSVEGAIEAQRTGDFFRAHGIEAAEVRSSQWCRCLETGRWLKLGPVEPMPALNSFFADRAGAPEQTAAVREFLASRTSTKPLVLVTHQVNITALTEITPRSGEIVVIVPPAAASDAIEVLGRIPPPQQPSAN
jgi:phosphohistidine phosphatase SixA